MKTGDEIGNYVIDAEVGRGSFAIVYRAHNKNYGEMQRAIKVLRDDAHRDPELVKLFEREAAILQTVDSPHVCRIFDFGYTSDGRPYISMEMLEGETLAAVTRRGPLPVETALDFILQICAGLGEVHRQEIVHRDIKPANIFVTRRSDGTSVLKLLDFNIAKGMRPTVGTTLSRPDAGPGTDHYMSPEQILDPSTVDAATDVWAVGAVMFELVTGVPPFRGASPGAIKVAIVNGDRHDLPETAVALAPILERCLVERSRRLASIAELSTEIRRALAHPEPHTPVPDASAPAMRRQPRSANMLDAIARQWPLYCLGVFALGLTLLLGSFAAHPDLNEFVEGPKRIGYISSFNWSIVHTFLSPLLLALVARLISRTNELVARWGVRGIDEWHRRCRRIVVLWIVLSLLFAVAYALVEWRPFLSGDCDGGTFLGWPNKLCAATRSPASFAFMGLAMLAQITVMSIAWLLFSVVVWSCDLLFGRTAVPSVGPDDVPAITDVFRTALWAWLATFTAMFLARLWSFHVQTPMTDGIVQTLLTGVPHNLFELNLHTQPDMGSMIAGTVMFVGALGPFVLLRLRFNAALPRAYVSVLAFALAALAATAFPRFGVFCLTGLGLGILVARVLRRSPSRSWLS